MYDVRQSYVGGASGSAWVLEAARLERGSGTAQNSRWTSLMQWRG